MTETLEKLIKDYIKAAAALYPYDNDNKYNNMNTGAPNPRADAQIQRRTVFLDALRWACGTVQVLDASRLADAAKRADFIYINIERLDENDAFGDNAFGDPMALGFSIKNLKTRGLI